MSSGDRSDAGRLAREIDRLVLGIHHRVGPEFGDRLRPAMRDLGLATMEPLPPLVDFLHADALTRELARARLPYVDQGQLDDALDRLVGLGVLREDGEALVASAPFHRLLDIVVESKAELAGRMWGDRATEIDHAGTIARDVALAVQRGPVVAVHRSLPEHDDGCLRFLQRLVTLRLIRQHDHVQAWTSRGLTATEIVALSTLRSGDVLEIEAPGVETLVDRGLADGSPAAVTAAGAALRDSIEADTDQRTGETWNLVDETRRDRFADLLSILPPHPEDP